MDILLASQNEHKIEELKAILEGSLIKVFSLSDFKDDDDVIEDGNSFKENAYLKAKYFYDKYKMAVVADDSGLVIPSLNNEPGIFSARYSGTHGDHLANNLKVLEKTNNLEDRTAYFVSTIAYINIKGEVFYFEGRLHGIINREMKGTNGFGYDPLFYVPEMGKTLGELPNEVKNSLSHRFLALTKLTNHLKKEEIKNGKQSNI